MKDLHYRQPYTDDTLYWNEKKQMYQITPAYAKDRFDISYKDDKVLERRLEKNSKKIYSYIKNICYQQNRIYVNYILNHTKEGRDFLEDVLSSQLEADLETGYNDLTLQPAINITNGQVIDRNVLRENQVSIDTEQIIDNNRDYFGFNLFIQTAYPQSIFIYLYTFIKR